MIWLIDTFQEKKFLQMNKRFPFRQISMYYWG